MLIIDSQYSVDTDIHVIVLSIITRFLLLHISQALDCGPPPVLANGSVATQNGTVVGSKSTYTCSSKYAFTVNSSIERACQSSGEWSNETMECSKGE